MAAIPRVILADEQSMVSDLIACALRGEFEVVAKVREARALVAAAALLPDIVILDADLPESGGPDTVRSVLRVSPSTRVVVLSVSGDETLASAMLDAGACGYVMKTSGLEELTAALREVHRGKVYVTPQIASRLPPRDSGEVPNLTPRERQVLALLMDGKLMREIGQILDLAPRTVAFHKYRMMKKLRVRSSAELIRAAVVHSLVR